MTKILSIVPYTIFPPKMGGQKGIALFNRAFSKEVELVVATVPQNVSAGNEDYGIVQALSRSPFRYVNPFLYFKIRSIIRQQKVTHLMLEHPYLGWLGWLIKHTTHIRIIIHSHNIEAERFRSTGKWWWRILRFYERFTHRMADVNFFISDEDRNYAMEHYGLKKERCTTITYGFDFKQSTSSHTRQQARTRLCQLHQIPENHRILFFNGTLDYPPNLNALEIILHNINPVLQQSVDFPYTFIICGKNLPASMNGLKAYENSNIIYAGFVEDINLYFNGADLFVNPVTEGGGIKTKLVEALGAGMNAVSTPEGAIGVPVDITGGKLSIAPANNWQQFAHTIIDSGKNFIDTPPSYYDHFYWGSIAKKAANFIRKIN